MAVLNNNALVGASGKKAGGYQISRSLRFNSADSAYLSRTPASAGNRQLWTWSGWIKRVKFDVNSIIYSAVQDGNNGTVFNFDVNNCLNFFNYVSGGYSGRRITTPVYRDPSAWYHIVLVWDSANATVSNRIRIYVNGTEVTTFSTSTDPSSANSIVNSTNAHYIGADVGFNNQYSNLYLADIHFIDGQALTPSSFAETDATTGQWIPKLYSGSYGTNGFKLNFSDNSAATASALGKDTSGNSNNWTPTNFSVINTAIYSGLASGSPDTGAYKPSNMWTAAGASNTSNTQTSGTTSASGGYGNSVYFNLSSNPISATSAQLWILKDNNVGSYAAKIEINGTDITPSVLTTGYSWVGVTGITSVTSIRIPYGAYCGAIRFNGVTFVEGQTTDSLVDTPTSYGTGNSGGDVRGNFCTWNPLQSSAATLVNGNLDCTTAVATGAQTRGTIAVSTGKWYWEILVNTTVVANNIGIIKTSEALAADRPGAFAGGYNYVGFSGNKENNASASSYGATYGAGDVIGVALDLDAGTLVFYKNGTSQGTAFSSLSGEFIPAIGDGTGSSGMDISANFGQRPFAYPVSGFKALCDTNLPAPVVAKPNTVMDVKLYTATDGVSGSVSGVNFSPDFVWIKSRAVARSNVLMDTVRGTSSVLWSNLTDAQLSSSQYVSQFNSDGFNYGVAGDVTNGSTVAWMWDAGTSTVTNNNGSISSQVRANPSAGFSIVTYTTTGSASTVGHGLGVAPSLIITKQRNGTTAWYSYHASIGANNYLLLNSTAASAASSGIWNNTAPTSTVFTVGSGFGNGETYVAYAFSPVAGISSFGSYTGNGSSDGPFVFCNFRPRWVMVKSSDWAGGNWVIIDAARDTYNVTTKYLGAEGSYAEQTLGLGALDILSNGFKLKYPYDSTNRSATTFIYAAFAESPFQYARAR